MTSKLPAPPFDPELEVVRKALNYNNKLTEADIPRLRRETSANLDDAVGGRPIHYEERQISGPDGVPVTLSIFRPAASQQSPPEPLRPCIYHTHGGGLAGGNRFLGMHEILTWALQLDLIAVSVEYRQPPEHRYPAAVEDCYTGLLWTAAHAAELRIDLANLVIAGGSAGGGLAAATSLIARDRGEPALRAQLLMCPMLDCRGGTVSSAQFVGDGIVWDRESNERSWRWYLGEEGAKAENVSPYASPALAETLARLPEAFIDVGAAEVFRDEAVAYARRLWEAGVQAELHVWPGAFHAFFMFAPEANVSKACVEARTAWITRLFGSAESKL